MTLEKIKNWINNPKATYQEGLKIYNEFKKSTKHDAYFAKVENADSNSQHFKILKNQVERIYRIQRQSVELNIPEKKAYEKPKGKAEISVTEISHSKPIKKEPSIRIDDNPYIRVEELPNDLKEKFKRNKQIPTLMNEARASINNLNTSKEDRVKFYNDLSMLEEERKENWKAIDEWWKSNKGNGNNNDNDNNNLSEDDKIKQAIANEKRIKNLKIYISRDEKKLAEAIKQKKKQRARKKIEDRINSHKKELNSLQGE